VASVVDVRVVDRGDPAGCVESVRFRSTDSTLRASFGVRRVDARFGWSRGRRRLCVIHTGEGARVKRRRSSPRTRSRRRRSQRGARRVVRDVGGDVVRRIDARCGDRGAGAKARTRELRRFKRTSGGDGCFDRREIVAREGWGEDEEGEIGQG